MAHACVGLSAFGDPWSFTKREKHGKMLPIWHSLSEVDCIDVCFDSGRFNLFHVQKHSSFAAQNRQNSAHFIPFLEQHRATVGTGCALMGSPPGWHQAVPIRTFSCPWAAWTGLVRSFPRWWMTGAYWVLLAQLAIRVTVRFPEVTAWCKVSRRWFGCLWILSQDWDIGQFGSRSKTVRFFVVAAAIASVAGG